MRRVLVVVAALLAPSVVAAQSEPRLEVTVPVEIQYDGVYDSGDLDAELGDMFTTTEPAISFRLGSGLSVQSSLTYEPINDAGNDRFFSNQGLYVQELFLNYQRGRWTGYAGKISPSFGLAWDMTPGIYGSDFGEDYELSERIGLGGSVDFSGPGATTQTFSANAFYQDHSGLTRSWFHKRARVRETDGGASNTGDLSSFSATLTGPGAGLLSAVNYQLSYDHLAAGQGNPTDEDGYALALWGDLRLSTRWELEHFVEIAYFDGAKAAAEDRTYGTIGAAIKDGTWEIDLSFSTRSIDPDANLAATADDELFQFGVSRDLPYGMNLGLGYRYVEAGNVDSHTVGLLLTREFGFSAL
ncbi:MAG: hypothetical protein HQ495_14360 [Alphaproteobacteria bacterium]|nr:hypothetical protein [Alphaproteobacteria bacterium]